MLSDGPNGVRAGLDISAVVLVAATVVALTQPRMEPGPAVSAPVGVTVSQGDG
ncbi:MAG: hypothetical protein M3Y91_03025 [Actinomycetota bacterium]|nr:hypothetical protein [Actinomycetota bacterium]